MKPTWVSKCGTITAYLGDSLAVLPTLGGVDAVVTDPPYGMNLDTDYSGFNGWSGKGHAYQPIIGDDAPFDPTPFLCIGRAHLFCGAQYFCRSLPENGGWLVFNKRGDGQPSAICFGDCELAWCDVQQSVRIYSHMWHGVARWSTEGRLHPSQKPVGLMAWCLEQVKAAPGETILDPFAGSFTTAVACLRTGRKCVVIEREPSYFEAGVKRVEEELTRHPLFPEPQPTQRELI